MITVQNYKQKRDSFDISKLDKDTLEVFNAVDEEFDGFMELYSQEESIKEVVNSHIDLVNELFKESNPEPKEVKDELFHVELLQAHNNKFKALGNIDFVTYVKGNEKPELVSVKKLSTIEEMMDEAIGDNSDDFHGYRFVNQKGETIGGRVLDKAVRKKIENQVTLEESISDITGRTLQDAILDAPLFRAFAGKFQQMALLENDESEESDHLIETVDRLEKELNDIPKIYAQDGLGEDAIVYAHLFHGGTDMLITEYSKKDNQAFGFTILNGDSQMAELGYISMNEVQKNKKIELDFYWKPVTIKEAKYKIDPIYFPDPKKEVSAKQETTTANETPVEKKPTAKKTTKTQSKKVEKVVDAKEVSHFSAEYMLIRRFFNAIKKNEVLSYRSVQLMYMAFNKSSIERKVRKTSADAELFDLVHGKVVKMFKALDNEGAEGIEVDIKDQKLIEQLHEYVGEQKINYAIKLLKSFIGIQGKKPDKDKVERLLKRFENAITKERVVCKNRLWKEFIAAKNELSGYLENPKETIEPNKLGLSAAESSIKHEETIEIEPISEYDQELIDNQALINSSNAIQYDVTVTNGHTSNERAGVNRNAPAPNLEDVKDIEVIEPIEVIPEQVGDSFFDNQSATIDDTVLASSPAQDFKVITKGSSIAPKGRTNQVQTNLPDELKGIVKKMSYKSDKPHVYYDIKGDLAQFLGNVEIKPKESVAITLDGPQGGGKTRMVFQLQDMFADAGYKGLFASLEEHPDSALITDKKDKYIKPHNQDLIDTVSDSDLVNGFDTLKKLIPFYDVIYIDSWGKLQELQKALDFDRDLRKAFNGKLFVVIFQRTADNKMRGGSKSAFDGDIIMKLEKDDDYRKSYAYFDKHRYSKVPLDQLKYNIYHQKMNHNVKEETIEL